MTHFNLVMQLFCVEPQSPDPRRPRGTGWGLGSGVALGCHPSSLPSPLRCPDRNGASWRGWVT